MECGAIRDKGWTQGSLFDDVGSAQLADRLGLASEGDCRFVLVSHPCDIVNPSLKAVPDVEVCRIRACDKDGNYLHGKNSRILQLSVRSSTETTVIELNCSDLVRIDRSTLVDIGPSTSKTLDAQEVRTLRNWLANRYRRSALPDEFNERRRQAWAGVRRKAKSGGIHLQGVYIALDPRDRELSSNESYRISLLGVMTDSDYEDVETRSHNQSFLTEISTILQDCAGIEVDDWEVRSESEVSLSDIKFLQRLDLDDISLRKGEHLPEI